MEEADPRQRILDAAEDAFADAGIAGARVNAIADAAGVNKAMLYYYFGSKEELYVAVLERMFDQVSGVVEGAWSGAVTPTREDVERFLHAYRTVLRQHPRFPHLMIREMLDGGARAAEVLGPRVRGMLPVVATVILRGQQVGGINPHVHPGLVLPTVIAPFVFFAVAHPVISEVTGLDVSVLEPEWDRTAAEVLLNGLMARPEE